MRCACVNWKKHKQTEKKKRNSKWKGNRKKWVSSTKEKVKIERNRKGDMFLRLKPIFIRFVYEMRWDWVASCTLWLVWPQSSRLIVQVNMKIMEIEKMEKKTYTCRERISEQIDMAVCIDFASSTQHTRHCRWRMLQPYLCHWKKKKIVCDRCWDANTNRTKKLYIVWINAQNCV